MTWKDVYPRNYTVIMVAHGLEKSLSHKNRNTGSGWRNAFKLIDLLRSGKYY